jgi:hypothetical protein
VFSFFLHYALFPLLRQLLLLPYSFFYIFLI